MSEAVSHRSPPPRRSMFFPPAEWTHPMPNLFWQRWAPITALSLVALAAALIFWMQPDESSPVAIVDPAPLAVAAPGPVSTTAADRDTHDAPRPPPAPEPAGDDAPMSNEQREARLAAELAGLEQEFLAEPVSPGWSFASKRVIAEALSAERTAAHQGPAPLSHDAECRSTTCRIRITYRDEMDAQMGEIFLLGDIAGTLPSANFGRLAGAGGTVQLVMYADTCARPSRP